MKRIVRSFLPVLVCLFTYTVGAQSIYAVSSQDRLYKLSPESCSSEYIADLHADDIAYEQGRLYFLAWGVTSSIDPLTGAYVHAGADQTVFGGNALCGDGQGNLYAAGSKISRYSIATKTTTVILDLNAAGYYSSGDLEYRNGNLYLAATRISSYTPLLLRITSDPVTATPETGLQQYSMGLAIDDDGSFYVAMDNALYLYDQQGSGEHWVFCEEVFPGSLGVINGMTSGPDDLGINWHPLPEPVIVHQPGLPVTVTVPPGVQASNYRVVNTLGQLVQEGSFHPGTTTLDLAPFAAGAYFLRMDGAAQAYKLVVP